MEAIERHGEKPEIIPLKNAENEIMQLKSFVSDFEKSEFNSLGIICKTQKQADDLYEELNAYFEINLLNAISVALGSGIVITTAHLAKGLEFDQVIVPFCTEKNYCTEPHTNTVCSLYQGYA